MYSSLGSKVRGKIADVKLPSPHPDDLEDWMKVVTGHLFC